MKIANAPIERQSNHRGEQFEGRLNTAKLGLFMKNLISNYNNPELATLREWVSNAHDSHVTAGQSKPVKITLPTRFSSTLTVEDFGIGMSFEDVQDTYAVFLSSTKDEDNDGIGGFGIGGKSALALADQYTMIAVKDGLKNIFILERSDTGGLKVTPAVKNEPTDLHNGVKVSVAVSNTGSFHPDQVAKVLEGWRSDELEIIGGEFKSFHNDSVEFSSGLIKKELFNSPETSFRRQEFRVFVGPVAYDIPRSFWQAWTKSGQDYSNNFIRNFGNYIAVKVTIGDVTFPSSREVIEDTEANNKVILEAVLRLEKDIQSHVDDMVKNFSSFEEAYAFAGSNFATRSNAKVIYEGRDLNHIQYEGFKAFYVSASTPQGDNLRLESVPSSELITLGSKNVHAVVRVKNDDSNFSDDTYRKYIRGAALEIYSGNRKGVLRSGYGRTCVLLTEKEDDLHEVTGKLYHYEELRKAAPVAAKGSVSRAKLTDQERMERVGEISVLHLQHSDNYYYNKNIFFSKHPAFTSGDPILIQGKDFSAELIPALEAIFEIKDRLVIVQNKLSSKQISTAFPKAISFEEYLALSSKAERKTHRANLERLTAVNAQFGFGSGDISKLERLVKDPELSDQARGLFDLDDCLASACLSRLNYYGSQEVFKALQKHLKIDGTGRVYYKHSPSAPFSLFDIDKDVRDLVEYLNWMAPKFLKTEV